VKGRRGGRKEPNGCGGCRESPRRGKPPRWKAVCLERGLYGLGRSGWKRTKLLILPGRNILIRQVDTGNGTSLAAYFIELTKAVIERCLETELDSHLGYPKHGRKGNASGNMRNGHSQKTLKGEQGHIDIEMPRDRQSTFEPQLVKKGQTRLRSALMRKSWPCMLAG